MCKITIVIPICNVENYVKTCVESAMKQTLQDIEIICIDDASTDMSSKILKDCAKQDPRIKIISYDDNKSASQARRGAGSHRRIYHVPGRGRLSGEQRM